MSLIIYSGAINSGKTTNLFNWSLKRKDVYGFLQLKDEDYLKRYFYNIQTDEKFVLSAQDSDCEEEVVKIGEYSFLKTVFLDANNQLIESVKNSPNYVVIDEWGFLEENDGGLNQSISYILENKIYNKLNCVIVVRDYLVERFLTKFNLKRNEIKIVKDLNDL